MGPFPQSVHFSSCKILSHQVWSIQSTRFFPWWLVSIRFMFSSKKFSVLAAIALITECLLPFSIGAIVKKRSSFIKIIQPISPISPWENGAKQMRKKLPKQNCRKGTILCPNPKDKDTCSRVKCTKQFIYLFIYLFCFEFFLNLKFFNCRICLACLTFYKSPWCLQSWPKYFRQTVVFLWDSTLREKFNFYFSRIFC